MTLEKEDRILLSVLRERMMQCRNRDIPTHTGFLDMRQAALAEEEFRNEGLILAGGYRDAERRIALFLPDWAEEETYLQGERSPLCILRAVIVKFPGAGTLTHRDYLGSLLGLGVDRSVSGDILVHKDGADLIILRSMSEFLLQNYSKAGRISLSCHVAPLQELRPQEVKITEKRDTVASLRLDCCIASVFCISRGRAQEAILAGLVAVNSLITEKTDRQIEEGDRLTLRGKGRVRLLSVGSPTRKDRLPVVWEEVCRE